MTEDHPHDWLNCATEEELSRAMADLETAVETAREAGRPVTADALLHEARGVEAELRRRLLEIVDASRNRAPFAVDYPETG